MSDNSKLNRHKYSIRVDFDCSVCGVNGLDESCEDCQGEGKYWVTQLIPRDVLDTITQDAIALNATSSDNSKLIEALECAKYAIENPDSNQDFAVWAIDHALNSATSSERVSISREDLAALHRDRVNALGQVGMSSDPLLERIEATLWSDSK